MLHLGAPAPSQIGGVTVDDFVRRSRARRPRDSHGIAECGRLRPALISISLFSFVPRNLVFSYSMGFLRRWAQSAALLASVASLASAAVSGYRATVLLLAFFACFPVTCSPLSAFWFLRANYFVCFFRGHTRTAHRQAVSLSPQSWKNVEREDMSSFNPPAPHAKPR